MCTYSSKSSFCSTYIILFFVYDDTLFSNIKLKYPLWKKLLNHNSSSLYVKGKSMFSTLNYTTKYTIWGETFRMNSTFKVIH